MLSITLQIVMFASFITLMVVIWRVSRWPRWRIRAVVYGWAAVFFWAIFWAALMPMCFRNLMDSHTQSSTFPDGTIAAAAMFGGWFWPIIVVGISSYRDRRKTGGTTG
jgi:hypothetical protein